MFGSAPFTVNLQRLYKSTIACLLPATCAFCGAPGQREERCDEPLDLCPECEAWLPRREVPLDPESGWFAPYDYAPPVDHAIRQLKFHGEIAYARLFGQLLAHARREAPLPDLLVPVPLHDRRLAERGYNQAALITHYAARVLELPCVPRALARVVETKEQSHLEAAARAQNVRGAFRIADPHRIEGRSIALIDDVVTTGSTAREAGAALLAGGASRVVAWAVARSGRG